MKKLYLLICFLMFSKLYSAESDWIRVNIPAQYNKNSFLEIYFLPDDMDYGWISGFNGVVIRTTDGGYSWTGTTIPGANQLEGLHFVSRKVGYTSGNGNDPGVIFKTTDGGVSWENITPTKITDGLWGNYFYDENNGMVVGGGCDGTQQFFRTTDGGNSWHLFESEQENTGLTDVILYPDGKGYATSSGNIWFTSDGGYSWAIKMKDGNEDWQEDLWIFNNTFLVPYSGECSGGDAGGIRTSRDNCKTWSEFKTGKAMFGAFLHDDKRGWACGWGGSLYKTTDAGINWIKQTSAFNDSLSLDDIYFVEDSIGWIAGKGIYTTKNNYHLKPNDIKFDEKESNQSIFIEIENVQIVIHKNITLPNVLFVYNFNGILISKIILNNESEIIPNPLVDFPRGVYFFRIDNKCTKYLKL